MEGEHRVYPDQVSYTIALGSWLGAESIVIDDAKCAEELVQRALRLNKEQGWNCKPDTHVFATLMQVCAKVRGSPLEQDRALQIALNSVDACLSGFYGEVNHVAYASCMKAVNRLCHDDARKIQTLDRLFEVCANEGHVSKQVIISMKIGVWKDRAPPIKASWSRRVPFQSKPR